MPSAWLSAKLELSTGGWMIIALSPLLSKQHLVRHHQTRSYPRQVDLSDEAFLFSLFERFCWWSSVPLCPLENITWCYICSRSPRELGCSVPCIPFRVRRLLTTSLPPLGAAIYGSTGKDSRSCYSPRMRRDEQEYTE